MTERQLGSLVASRGSGQIRVRMVGQEAAGSVVIDERVVGQPLDRPALGAGIAERVPRWQQIRILLVEFVLEAAEGAFALDGPGPGRRRRCPRRSRRVGSAAGTAWPRPGPSLTLRKPSAMAGHAPYRLDRAHSGIDRAFSGRGNGACPASCGGGSAIMCLCRTMLFPGLRSPHAWQARGTTGCAPRCPRARRTRPRSGAW